MSEPLSISVIIPVFQDASGIQACVHHLERQSIDPDRFEVIVVDNGSDPPLGLPQSRLAALSMVRCAIPGSYAARNAGVRAARGTILAFTDADCVPDPRWLECGVRALAEPEDREVVVGGEVRFSGPGRKTAVSLYQTMTGFGQAENIAGKGFSATANLFCRRSTFERVGPFEERLMSGGDREWAWRAHRAGVATIFAPDALVMTPPRSSLGGALRQARRVAAGRYQLRRSGLAADRRESLRPLRPVLSQLVWILSRNDYSVIDRLRVLAVASLIKVVSMVETVRVRLGGQAERR